MDEETTDDVHSILLDTRYNCYSRESHKIDSDFEVANISHSHIYIQPGFLKSFDIDPKINTYDNLKKLVWYLSL